MTNANFIKFATSEVNKYVLNHIDKSDDTPDFDTFVVWSCKTLQNHKCLISTTLHDGMYYECTYNGDKNEMYLDAYKKFENKKIICEIFRGHPLHLTLSPARPSYAYTGTHDPLRTGKRGLSTADPGRSRSFSIPYNELATHRANIEQGR